MSATISRGRLGRRIVRRGTRPAVGTLRMPDGFAERSLSDPESRDAVGRWLRRSPEHTIYHLAPYIDFLRAQGALADVFLISREGGTLFALAVHSWDATGVDGGYSGVVFPPG